MRKIKKYDVPLALASTKSIDKLALARMLIDMMELDELYEPLSYKGSFGVAQVAQVAQSKKATGSIGF